MTFTTVGLYLAKRLEEIGLHDYFAIPGDYNLTLLDEMLKNTNLKMINCCNELNAGYAADGYARENGAAALFLTFSVGSLSALNAITGAYAENLPVIVISSGPNINSIVENRVLHHTTAEPHKCELYVNSIFEQVTAYSVTIRNVKDAAFFIDRAIHIALVRKKPVHIEIACNLSTELISAPNPLNLKPIKKSDPASLKACIEHVSRFLNKARQTVLVAGGKLRAAEGMESFKKLSDQSGYGVACMPNAKGFFPETHSNFIGIYWGNTSSPGCREVVESSDAYLFAGPIFNDYTTVGFSALINQKKLVNVAPDHVVVEGQFYNGIILAEFLEALSPKLNKNQTAVDIYNGIKGEAPVPLATPESMQAPITTRRLFGRINEMLTSQTTVLAETGDSWFNGMNLHLPEGCKFEIQMQYGSIGWSVGAFLGLVAANTKRKVIGLVGDGSFQMTAQEISTVLRYNYSGIFFLLNNSGYGIEIKIHDGPYNQIQHWKYAELVNVFKDKSSGWSCVVRTETELMTAIEKAKTFSGLSFIEVILDVNDCNKSLMGWGVAVAKYNSRPIKNEVE